MHNGLLLPPRSYNTGALARLGEELRQRRDGTEFDYRVATNNACTPLGQSRLGSPVPNWGQDRKDDVSRVVFLVSQLPWTARLSPILEIHMSLNATRVQYTCSTQGIPSLPLSTRRGLPRLWQGALSQSRCPSGCVELLVRSGVQLSGADVVVLGRSNIVGLPVALMLVHRDATVTLCHSGTAGNRAC